MSYVIIMQGVVDFTLSNKSVSSPARRVAGF